MLYYYIARKASLNYYVLVVLGISPYGFLEDLNGSNFCLLFITIPLCICSLNCINIVQVQQFCSGDTC